MLRVGQQISGKIESMAFGGEGILRHNGMVVFVPFTAVGDQIEAKIVFVKKSFARAYLMKVCDASDQRVEPKCGHFGVCGGCQLQHLGEDTQLMLKHSWVRDALTRIGKISNVEVGPVEAAHERWEYRRSIKMRFDQTLKLSYVNASSNGLVPIKSCAIFKDDAKLFESLNAYIAAAFANVAAPGVSVTCFKADAEKFILFVEIGSELDQKPVLPDFVQGCLIKTPTRTHEIGDISMHFSQVGMTFKHSPLSFVQNHPEQSAKLSDRLVQLVVESGAKTVFDLYCGFGVSAIALAKKGLQVTAVEGNAHSIQLAKENASQNCVFVHWVCDDVAKFIGPALRRSKPDLVIVNPPRTGLAPHVSQALAQSDAATIAYVSCMPQTLARDLAILCAAGYHVDLCQPYDMFPQTTHVETLVWLKKYATPS